MNRLLLTTLTTIACLSVNFSQQIPEAIAQTETNLQANNTKATNKFPVNQVLSALRGKTNIPILLPSDLPFSTNNFYFKNEVETNSYLVEINVIPNCDARACYRWSISGKKGGKFIKKPTNISPRDQYKTITLANQTPGIFVNSCGPYCMAYVEWEYQGVLYRVNVKNGRESNLVQIANSAIKAGPR